MRGILLDAGTNDEHHLEWGHRLLSHYLDEAGITHRCTENTGNHGGRSSERTQMALQWLAGVLAAAVTATVDSMLTPADGAFDAHSVRARTAHQSLLPPSQRFGHEAESGQPKLTREGRPVPVDEPPALPPAYETGSWKVTAPRAVTRRSDP